MFITSKLHHDESIDMRKCRWIFRMRASTFWKRHKIPWYIDWTWKTSRGSRNMEYSVWINLDKGHSSSDKEYISLHHWEGMWRRQTYSHGIHLHGIRWQHRTHSLMHSHVLQWKCGAFSYWKSRLCPIGYINISWFAMSFTRYCRIFWSGIWTNYF